MVGWGGQRSSLQVIGTPMRERYSDELGRYYTQQVVGDLLVAAMAMTSPRTVVELGSGSGVLVRSAAKVWKRAKFLTVDIDSKVSDHAELRSRPVPVTHHVGDALRRDLRECIGLTGVRACAAICNPPYIRPKWQNHFGEILEDVGLSGAVPRFGGLPADVLFIAQNLRLLKKGGKLGIILPDGLITGERFAAFRRLLVEKHAIERAIELPVGVFSRTEAKAHVIILRKDTPQPSEILLTRLEGDGSLMANLAVSTERAIGRADYTFHSQSERARASHSQAVRVGAFLDGITRGRHSSSMRRCSKVPIFHTSDYLPGSTSVSRAFCIESPGKVPKNAVAAQPGDILLARVGRNFSEKVAEVERGFVPISDCVFALRPKPGQGKKLMAFLSSTEGRAALNAAAHGVGARFITVNALQSIVVDI